MQYTVTEEVQRVTETKTIVIDLPEVPQYYFCNRRAIAVYPVFTNWLADQGKDEEVYEYRIVIVDCAGFVDRIEYQTLQVSAIQRTRDNMYAKGSSISPAVRDFIIELGQQYYMDTRTKEQFENDFNKVIQKLQDVVNQEDYPGSTKI